MAAIVRRLAVLRAAPTLPLSAPHCRPCRTPPAPAAAAGTQQRWCSAQPPLDVEALRAEFTTLSPGLMVKDRAAFPQRQKCNETEVPERGIVRCSLGITLVDGTVVRNLSPFIFETGSASVIRGLEEGAKYLRVGQRATFYIDQDAAYGETGAVGIPPYSDLICILEIHSVKSA